MKQKKKQKKLRITEADYMLANRRAARLEEITEAGVKNEVRIDDNSVDVQISDVDVL